MGIARALGLYAHVPGHSRKLHPANEFADPAGTRARELGRQFLHPEGCGRYSPIQHGFAAVTAIDAVHDSMHSAFVNRPVKTGKVLFGS